MGDVDDDIPDSYYLRGHELNVLLNDPESDFCLCTASFPKRELVGSATRTVCTRCGRFDPRIRMIALIRTQEFSPVSRWPANELTIAWLVGSTLALAAVAELMRLTLWFIL